MNTKQTIERYFVELNNGTAWQSHLAEDMTFVSHGTPKKEVSGKGAYLESTRGFFSMVVDVELRQLTVEGERAAAQTRYRLQPPHGDSFVSDVCEILTTRDDQIGSIEIYFDSAPYPRPPQS